MEEKHKDSFLSREQRLESQESQEEVYKKRRVFFVLRKEWNWGQKENWEWW